MSVEIDNNGVEITPERIEKEWQRIELRWGVVAENEEGEGSEGGEAETEIKPVLTPEEFDSKVRVTKEFVNGGLKLAFFMMKIENIPEHITEDFCKSWAVVIVERFPENPVTDFMDSYRDLIAAAGASLVLFGAIRVSRSEAEQVIETSFEQKAEELKDAA